MRKLLQVIHEQDRARLGALREKAVGWHGFEVDIEGWTASPSLWNPG
jgi:hypothetical protein